MNQHTLARELWDQALTLYLAQGRATDASALAELLGQLTPGIG
jgi:hypothetical protein